MKTSLPACPKNHPGIASVILVTVCTRTNGVVYKRPYCTVCALSPARMLSGERQEAARRGIVASSALESLRRGAVGLDSTGEAVVRTGMSSWRQIAWNVGFVLLGSVLAIVVLRVCG